MCYKSMPPRIDRNNGLETKTRIAEMLRDQRSGLNLTQTALARLARVPQPEISRIESGRYNPTVETVAALGEALGLELTLRPTKSASLETNHDSSTTETPSPQAPSS